MAKPQSNAVDAWVSDIRRHLNEQYTSGYLDGQKEALSKIQGLFGGTVVGAAAKAVKKAAAAPATKTPAVRRKRRNPWANLTPEERQARVNAIRKGKGLPLVPLASAAEPKKRGPTVRDNSPPVIPIEQATTPVDDSETFHKGV